MYKVSRRAIPVCFCYYQILLIALGATKCKKCTKKQKKIANKVIDFVTFLTIYRGAWISKSNSGVRVADRPLLC